MTSSPINTNHDGHKRFLELLVQHLGAHVDARKPTAVTRMTVVPSYGVLQSADLNAQQVTIK